jgi:hypothetical protein
MMCDMGPVEVMVNASKKIFFPLQQRMWCYDVCSKFINVSEMENEF